MTSTFEAGPEQTELEAEEVDFEGGPIVGRVALTTEDFTSVWATLPQHRRVFLQLAVTVVAIPLFWLAFNLLNSDGRAEPAGMTWTVVAISLLLVPGFAFKLWRARGVWAKNGLADLRGAEGVEFRFDSAGFSFHAPGLQLHQSWSSLYRCIETAHAFAIYTSPAALIVVPKRAFAAAEQARLRARLFELIPNRQLRGTNVWRPLGRTVVLWVFLVVAFIVIWQVLDSK